MSPRMIACLHTAAGNVPIFDQAAAHLPVRLLHIVRPELLAQAEAEGLSENVITGTRQALTDLSAQADAVVLTCSTLGPIAENFEYSSPVSRADRSLARNAVSGPGSVTVLCTAPATLASTASLFENAAKAKNGSKVSVELVEGAWSVLKSGQLEAYYSLIAKAGDAAFEKGAAKVALAQVSMAPSVPYFTKGTPLTVPGLALKDALEFASNDKR